MLCVAMKETGESELRRVIGLPHATALVIGTIIGASIFVQPSEITGQVPSIAGVLLVWLVSGVLTLFGALACAELASIFTRSGGVYVYLAETYSPAAGFLWGWAMFWSMHSGIIAALSMVVSRYMAYLVPLDERESKSLAIVTILVLSLVNYLGVKQGSRIQALFTLGKIIAVVLIILAGFALGSRIPEHFVSGPGPAAPVSVRDFFMALMAGLFAFGGWHMVTYASEESIDPRSNIPKALVIGTLIVTACYIALNTVYLYILPLSTVASSDRVAADAADALMGYGGGAFMSVLVVFSTLGALSGIILAGPRVYYAMARDGLIFEWAGRIHSRFRTPHNAILMQAAWSCVLVWTGSYRALFTRVVYTEWIFFGMMTVGLFILRRRKADCRYRMWGYPLTAVIFVASSFSLAASQIISDPRESAFGLALVLSGLPVYYLWTSLAKRRVSQA